MRREVNHKQNIQSSHKNKTWLTTLIDVDKWDCKNIYSSKVICQQILSTGKETKGKEGNQKKKKSKETHTWTNKYGEKEGKQTSAITLMDYQENADTISRDIATHKIVNQVNPVKHHFL